LLLLEPLLEVAGAALLELAAPPPELLLAGPTLPPCSLCGGDRSVVCCGGAC